MADVAEPIPEVVDPPWRVALISCIILILELALIRLVPAEVKVVSYFTNLVLMATFFGIGMGCILQRWRSLTLLLPIGLGSLASLIVFGRGILVFPGSEDVHYWLRNEAVAGQARDLPLVLVALAFLTAAALPFVALGQALARTMDQHPRLTAYGWDIAGSLVGTLVFIVASIVGCPPWIWPPVLTVVWAWLFPSSVFRRLLLVGSGLVFLAFAQSPHEWRWSPYYLVQYEAEPAGLRVWVNSGFHQFAIDFTKPEFRQEQAMMLNKWGQAYSVYREMNRGRSPRKVLILGAGTGNDVHVALSQGAEEILAVEIDPVILDLGKSNNPSRPYDDPRVTTVVDDARHVLRTSTERFDLVVLGTLDSQALLSGHANLRLENYVYTRESLADAKELLDEGGLLAVYYSVAKPWLYGRLYATVSDVFGAQTRLIRLPNKALFNTLILAARDRPELALSQSVPADLAQGIPSTDDWPFIYLERPTIAPVYWKLFAVVVALTAAAFLVLRRLQPVKGLYAHYLFLGLGFTLMESSAIVRLALVFGSTWTVNAVVFAAVLSTIFLANLAVAKGRAPSLRWAWLGLLASILVNYRIHVPVLFELTTPFRVLVAGLLVGVPVFFAAVCFSQLFKNEPVTGYPLGLNLVGAMAGGLVEYSSMLIGMRQVWAVVLIIYVLAWASSSMNRRLLGPPA